MKKNVLVVVGLAVLSTSAHATKSRMEALSQDSLRGSEYISDSRNIFRNPALLNQTKNYIVTEWGTSANADDSTAAPRAEGGFFREMGSFNYGLYLGNNGQDEGRNTAGRDFLRQDNALDLFLSGDMGVQWGAKLHYASSKDETEPAGTPFERKNSAFGLGLGVVAGEAEGYIDLTLTDKSTGNSGAGGLVGDEFKTKPSYIVGGSYKWSSVTFFASYEANKADMKLGATTTTNKDSTISLGAGRIHEINPTARIFSNATLQFAQSEPSATGSGKDKGTFLPVALGFEADATSWLVLRGSVAQNVIFNNVKLGNGKKQTTPNTTTVNGGATLNFGKLKVDGSIGTTGTTGTADSKTGVLSTNNLLTRVGVSYWF